MGSLSGLFQAILQEETDQIYFPDVPHENLKGFIDAIYEKLVLDLDPTWEDCDQSIVQLWTIPLDIGKWIAIPEVKVSVKSDKELATQPTQRKSRKVSKPALDIFKVGTGSSKNTTEDCSTNREDNLEIDDEALASLQDESIDPNFDYEAALKDDLVQSEEARHHEDSHHDDLDEDFDEDENAPTKKSRVQSRKSAAKSANKRTHTMHKNMQFVNKKGERGVYCVEALHAQIINREGTLSISHTSAPLKAAASSNHIRDLTRVKNVFHVLIGIRDNHEIFEGKPLAWTRPESSSQVVEQFDECVNVFSHVFGLSEADLISGQHLLNGQDGKTPMSYISDIQKRLFNKSTRFDLENELKDPEILQAHARPQRTFKELDIPLNDWTIDLHSHVSLFHDVVLVSIHKHAIECRQIHFVQNNPDLFGSILTRILYLVWSGGLQGSKIPRNDYIIDKYLHMKRITYRNKTAKKLLATEGDLPRKLPTFTCDICGETIQENAHGTKRSMHKRKHIIQNMECNCQLDKSGFDDKKRHYILFHSGWNVEPCPMCKWVGSKEALERHKAAMHSEVMCDECGKLCSNAEKLSSHRRSMHKMYQCKECLEEFVGFSKLKYHIGRFHSENVELLEMYKEKVKPESKKKKHPKVPEKGVFPCEKCGKIFKFDQSLKSQLKRNHGTEEDMPFRCKECGKRFFDKPKLKYHLMNVHIRSRPFICRYENCQSDFNNQSNLRQHEVKVHGALMGKVASINNYVSDEMMFTLAEVVHTSYNHRTEWI
eukprot:TCALIF_05044-PA protein Name:"Similar to ZNF430 Zinc finger protein 430 (Homo sapiens)" AED:0.16 eAED:0.16 QI:0/0.5/0/0.66/0.5/0.33/3/0/768